METGLNGDLHRGDRRPGAAASRLVRSISSSQPGASICWLPDMMQLGERSSRRCWRRAASFIVADAHPTLRRAGGIRRQACADASISKLLPTGRCNSSIPSRPPTPAIRRSMAHQSTREWIHSLSAVLGSDSSMPDWPLPCFMNTRSCPGAACQAWCLRLGADVAASGWRAAYSLVLFSQGERKTLARHEGPEARGFYLRKSRRPCGKRPSLL